MSAKRFKTKYFPNYTLFEAMVPAHASYAWKNICSVRDLFMKGLWRRVGNCKSICI